ncbi:MAG: nucleotidyltransferase domain-containing protein [Candidatus Omnitrophota bacterium]
MKKETVNLINKIAKKDKAIIAAYVFGSQIKDRANKYSDVDIAILFDDELMKEGYGEHQLKLTTELTEVLNKEIDLIVLNRAPIFLKYHILKDGVKIYERPDRREHNFEARAIIEYFDFLPMKNKMEEGMLKSIKEGY